MKLITYMERLEMLHKLVKAQRTGTPEELSATLGISRSRLYEMLDELRSYNIDVVYSRQLQSFCYVNDFEITFGVRFMNKIEAKDTNGGLFFFPSSFSGRKESTFALSLGIG